MLRKKRLSPSARKCFYLAFLTLPLPLAPLTTLACGPWLPERLLESGGERILSAPEMYFELEMKELATGFPTPFRVVPLLNEEAAQADYADALKTGRAKPASQPGASMELPKEFDQYWQGAKACYQHDIAGAKEKWKALLAMPADQRQYRSTWAAYMLGRINIDRPFPPDPVQEQDTAAEASPTPTPSPTPESPESKQRDEEAVKAFEQVRELARTGFADSLGLATASLGWEGYVELNRGEFEKAAKLYLEQLAAGDLGAINSLRAVADDVPDETACQSPLLRRLKTTRILCFCTPDMQPAKGSDPMAKWLAMVEKVNVDQVEEAERLGWMAYSMGRFEDARKWLKRSDPQRGLALWLNAKLAFRDGRLKEATDLMAQAVKKVPRTDSLQLRDLNPDEILPDKVAAGDLGLLQVARSEFDLAFQTFLQGDHWQDAAYVAENIFTTDELLRLVDREFPAKPEDDQATTDEQSHGYYRDSDTTDHRKDIRWLLARRLARNGQFTKARPYFPPKYREILDRYSDALKRGLDQKAASEIRAKALFDAAVIARHDGMELLGTELEPDAFIWDGQFEESDVRQERIKGVYTKENYRDSKRETKKVVVPVTALEKQRLLQSGVDPEKRFHYRYVAAQLAWKAAKLLPDNSDITADVLNTAGNWLKDRDDQAADPFLQALERRCPNTTLGKEVLKKHWFADSQGPWSQ